MEEQECEVLHKDVVAKVKKQMLEEDVLFDVSDFFKIFILSYLSFKFQNSNLFQKSYLIQNLILSYFKIKFQILIFKFQNSNFKI